MRQRAKYRASIGCEQSRCVESHTYPAALRVLAAAGAVVGLIASGCGDSGQPRDSVATKGGGGASAWGRTASTARSSGGRLLTNSQAMAGSSFGGGSAPASGNVVGGSASRVGTTSTLAKNSGGSAESTGGAAILAGATSGSPFTLGGARATASSKASGGATFGASGRAGASGAFDPTGGGRLSETSGGAMASNATTATGTGRPSGGAAASGGSAVNTTAEGSGGSIPSGGSPTSGGTSNTAGAGASPSDLWLDPDGSDSNPGTESQPLATLTAAHSKVGSGQTIWIKPGTYSWSSTVSLTKSGTESKPINLFAAAGTRPVFDFSGQPRDTSSARGIQIKGAYWHLKGFEVMKAGDNCIHISGSHNTIELLSLHNCCDAGLQITDAAASYNTVLNCDAYENYDATTGGENADGFAAKLELGPGNVFRGCRAWNNADDGWDLYQAGSVVVIEDSWAFLNGKLASGGGTSDGDGNGFKLGGAGAGAVHQVTGCFAFENLGCGFTRNNNTEVPILTDCGGRADGKGEYCSLTNSSPVSFSMSAAEAKAVQRHSDGRLPDIN